MYINKLLIASITIGVLLAGCGGGSSSGKSSSSKDKTKIGVFLDSPVVNIGYRTETLEGVTNSLGQYEYLQGETVTFFIGDLELPTVMANGTVTPLDIADSQDPSNSEVVNIIRLLQTLDKDGNLDNGITITETAISTATQVDFTLSESDFAASSAVNTLIANGGQDSVVGELVSTDSAVAHFESELLENGIFVGSIVGTWRSTVTENDFVSVTFYGDGAYVYSVYDSDSQLDEVGMELGTYTLNSETGVLNTVQTFDSNSGRGLSEDIIHFASVSGSTLTLSFDDNDNGVVDAGESANFSEIDTTGIVGSWRSTVTDNDFVSVTFYDDDTYLYSTYGSETQLDEVGMELGTYTLNSETGVLDTVQTFDSNSGRGLSEDIIHFASVSGSTLLLSFDDNDNGVVDDAETVPFLNEITFGSVMGVWELTASNTIFTFLTDGRYFGIEWENELGAVGFERGTYDIDNSNVSFTTLQNNDGDALLCNEDVGTTCADTNFEFSIAGDVLTLDPSNDTTFSINKQPLSGSAIEGVWELAATSTIFTFLEDGRYFGIEWENELGSVGFERGTYEIDGNNVSFTTIQNDDGDALLCNEDEGTACSSTNFEFSIAGGVLTLDPPNDTVFSIVRVQ